MESMHSLLLKRRSYRKFNDSKLKSDDVQLLLEAALLSPSSKNKRAWEFILVEDKEVLNRLSFCKAQNASFISKAALAVVVLGDPLASDVWVEDATIAATNMQLQAEDLNIGSCWVQVRERNYSDTISSGEYIADLLDIAMPLQVLCVLAFGERDAGLPPHDTNNLMWEKVHIGKYHSAE